MRSQWKRLLLAATLSLACWGATEGWYRSTNKSDDGNRNETPIAQVSRVGDEVVRRPATRLLWRSVNTGDNLYNGETIRTSARGELRIQLDQNRYIDLEPDSLIVLKKSQGEISLDLMEGSLFVQAKSEQTGGTGASTGGLVLNSKNGKVDLTGASASLSKGSGDSLDLQVLEGKAKIKDASGQEKEISQGKASSLGAAGSKFNSANVTILSPKTNKPFFIDPDHDPVAFQWQGFPNAWVVSVHAGSTRKEMKEIGVVKAAGESKLDVKLPLGKYWWKLVAKDPANNQVMGESSTQRMDIQGRYAPTVVFPVADAEIPIEKAPFDMTFKWQRGDEASNVTFEIATDSDLKKKIKTQSFQREEQMNLPGLKEGTYYWRMSAHYDGSDKPVIGKIQKFTIHRLAVKKDPVQIVWTLPEEKNNQLFADKPSLELTWEAKNRREDIATYRVQLVDAAEIDGTPQRLEVKESKVRAPVTKAGRYLASVEAYDKEGNVIGKSEPRSLAATEIPLLAAPQMIPAEGVIQSGLDGRSELKWQTMDGAKQYWLTILDKGGKELARKKYDGSSANLKNLMPGEYTVKLQAIDSYGRNGQEGSPRTLVVPDKSNIKAPTLKKIKVN